MVRICRRWLIGTYKFIGQDTSKDLDQKLEINWKQVPQGCVIATQCPHITSKNSRVHVIVTYPDFQIISLVDQAYMIVIVSPTNILQEELKNLEITVRNYNISSCMHDLDDDE